MPTRARCVPVLLKRMKPKVKALLSALLCIPLLLSCGSGTVTEDEPEPETREESGETEMNNSKFTSISENYNVDGENLTAKATVKDHDGEKYSAAYYVDPVCSGDSYTAEISVALDSVYSAAGLLFCASGSTVFDGFEGYAFLLRDKKVCLCEITGSSSSGMMVNELAHKAVERKKTGTSVRLRLVKDGNNYRLYYLDDMEGVEPWPEFEYTLTEHHGTGIGAVDNGEGASFANLTVEERETAPFPPGTRTYRNPVYTEEQGADPGILKYDGKYYCYASSAPIGYYVYVSDDLVNWKNEGLCMGEAWGFSRRGYYWAPEVVQRADGKFVMVASVEEHIGFAVADSPLGPFVPVEKWTFESTIDGHIFLDDDGKGYLFCVSWRAGHEYGIWAYELEDDLVTVKPETETRVLWPTDSWEMCWGNVTEGPFVLKHNGTYYLTYSGPGYDTKDYSVGYATADSPLGPYKKYAANPVLTHTSKLYGPGHHNFTTSPDGSEMFIVYHVHASTTAVHPRKICIDRARFAPTESGLDRIEVWGPTHTAEEYPK